jgi:hypothetical protein
MRDFSDHGDRFFQTVQIIGGPRTRAILQEAPDTGSVNDQFMCPKVTCRVRTNSLINSGSVIQTESGSIFLVCDHQKTAVWRTHLLLPCDRTVQWQRTTPTTDPVTGLSMTSGEPQLMGTPWVYWERPTRPQTDYTTRIPDIDYVVVTGAPVQSKDTINGHTILRFDIAMGVTVLGIRT